MPRTYWLETFGSSSAVSADDQLGGQDATSQEARRSWLRHFGPCRINLMHATYEVGAVTSPLVVTPGSQRRRQLAVAL
jgi:hypothetical protein